MIAEDVHDLAEHVRRLAAPDSYRPATCARCGCTHLHVHTRPERHPRGDASLPAVVELLQFRCARKECGATWRMLPLFLARHLWHPWKAVERAVMPDVSRAPEPAPPIRARTRQRWSARLASSARVLVVLLAMSVGAALEAVAIEVGLSGTRGSLALLYAARAATVPGERLSSLGALVHRLERGIRRTPSRPQARRRRCSPIRR